MTVEEVLEDPTITVIYIAGDYLTREEALEEYPNYDYEISA